MGDDGASVGREHRQSPVGADPYPGQRVDVYGPHVVAGQVRLGVQGLGVGFGAEVPADQASQVGANPEGIVLDGQRLDGIAVSIRRPGPFLEHGTPTGGEGAGNPVAVMRRARARTLPTVR